MTPGAVPRRVLVTGAAGVIGRSTVGLLLREGFRVSAMLRAQSAVVSFPPHENLTIVYADIRDAGAVRAALDGADVAVHLAAAKADEPDSLDVNVGGARTLLSACRSAGCRRIINVSTQSVKIAQKGLYARTKEGADALFEASGLEITTLLVSLVYGEPLSGAFGALAKVVRKLPVVPVLGNGRWVSAPVHVDDVARAILGCIEHEATIGKSYDIGGPDPVSLDALLDKIGAHLGARRPKLHIPFRAALATARVLTRLLRKPPLTVSNVLGSNQDTAIDCAPARRDFGFKPAGLDEGLGQVLGRERLRDEARVFSRYLIGRDAPQTVVERYLRIDAGPSSEPELEWVRRCPFLLPFVDAGAGVLRPDSIVRIKLLRLTAVLEADTTNADFFLKDPPGAPALILGAAWRTALGVMKMALGVPLFLILRRRP